jgi:hypothetical protein
MFDEPKTFEPKKSAQSVFLSSGLAKDISATDDAGSDEDSRPAFGYVRGLNDRALALQLRYRNGNSDWFSYSLLASWRYNPSVGLLLKFAGDIITLVLIRGSNLDATVSKNSVKLLQGLQHHRITWVREMDEDELRESGPGAPKIDGIQVAEFETNTEALAWLKKVTPVFVR